ncbi:kinesin-like protein [Coemansia sp. RSA 2675]|nr:kinesin-like protein [Coemansia sp. RSA 2675]
MSTKMNFGPEWMRSAPASNRLSVSGGEGGAPGALSADRLADPDEQYAAGEPANSGGRSRRYTHERLLELFKAQDFASTFAGSEHVFSEQPLAPVSLTELSSKEYELLSGPINSSASKRYSSTQQQQQQQAMSVGRPTHQQHQLPTHAYARNGNNGHRASNHGLSNNAWAKLRDPMSRGAVAGVSSSGVDYDALADLTGNSSHALSGLDQLAADESNSAWLRQPIARENVGSFGNDGVFRMGDDDGSSGGDLLEASSSRDSMLVGARTATSNYSAPGSSAGASSRHGMRPLHGRQPPGSLGYSDDDGGAWRDLSSAPATPAGQQHRLLELAEQVKWWYRDPQGSVQGPFSASHMQEWLSGGYFPSDLQVCYEGGSSFEPLGTMISRLGGPQNVFICAALASLTQGHPSRSGISTPATPNAISRAASVVQLRSPGGDIARSATGTPAARGSFYQLAPGSAAGSAAANCTTAQPSAYAQPAATSATQISTLLSDQLLIVSAIAERQYMITQYQDQHQQRLAKLMQDLSQEVNAAHYRAQMERAPVQNEYLVSLQFQAQTAEEKLRHDHLLLIQNQAMEIGRLEASIDPVIKEMVVRSGTEFAIGFINQQLQELSLMAATESAEPQAPVAVAEPTDAGNDQLVSNEAVVVRKDPAVPEPETSTAEPEPEAVASAAEADVAAVAGGLERVEIAANEEPVAKPAVPAKKDAPKAASAKSPAATQPASAVGGAKGGKSRSQSKASDTSAAKPASPWGALKTASKAEVAAVAAPAIASETSSANASTSVNVATPAPWSNSGAAAKGKQPKKSLLQIQQEEEEALRKRQLADEQQRVQNVAARGFGPTYADRLGGSASVAPRSLAAIMAEQSKESSRNSSSVSIADAHPADDSSSNAPSGWTVARVLSSQTAPTPPAAPSSGPAWGGSGASGPVSNGDLSNVLGAKPASGRPAAAKPLAAVSSSAGPVLPSISFLEWCHSRLSSLRGIDVYKFIEMLLTFPLKAPESTLEIITEQVYAYSTTLNGRAFAEDFVARRAKDHAAVRNGSAKSAPANWAFVLEATKSAAAGSAATTTSNGFAPSASNAQTTSRNRGASSAGSSFQVVGKKGKK